MAARLRLVFLAALLASAVCGCAAPTTVLVEFTSSDGRAFQDLEVRMTVGGTEGEPHALSEAAGLTRGSILVPLPVDAPVSFLARFEGHVAGSAVSGEGDTTTRAHEQVDLAVVVAILPP